MSGSIKCVTFSPAFCLFAFVYVDQAQQMAAQDPNSAGGYSQLNPEQMMVLQQQMGAVPEHLAQQVT